MMPSAPLDPSLCPLCGGPNGCAMAIGIGCSVGGGVGCGVTASAAAAEPCWCTREQFSAQLLQQVPPTARDKACICLACVQAAEGAA